MIVLKELGTAQDIFFIPRSYIFDKIVITNETTKAEQEFTVTAMVSGQYGYASLIVDLKELSNYIIKVYQGTTEVYYDKIFCTNQDIETYSINNGVYQTPPADANEFITV